MLLLDELAPMQNKQVLVSEAADDLCMMPSAKGGIRQPVPPHTHTQGTAHHHHHHQRAENVSRVELLCGSRLNSRGSSAEVALIEEN